jgi:ubiquinone/menaquinone biosynthesis C-methylase UbiE
MTQAPDDQRYWRSYFDRTATAARTDHARVGYTSSATAGMMHASLRTALGAVTGRWVLDAGCGDGQVTAALAADNFVVGADFSPAMAARAAERGLRPVCADLLALPFAGASFDLIICAEALSCLPDPLAALPGLIRLVKPGGRLLISGLNNRSLLRHVVRTIARARGGIEPHLMAPARAERILAEHGFEIEPLWWIGYVFGFVVQPRSRLARFALSWPATNFILAARRPA